MSPPVWGPAGNALLYNFHRLFKFPLRWSGRRRVKFVGISDASRAESRRIWIIADLSWGLHDGSTPNRLPECSDKKTNVNRFLLRLATCAQSESTQSMAFASAFLNLVQRGFCFEARISQFCGVDRTENNTSHFAMLFLCFSLRLPYKGLFSGIGSPGLFF